MNEPIPAALANTILLAEHDEATQRAVVDAVEKIVYNYLMQTMHETGASLVTYHQSAIERIALRAIKNHFVNANIY